MRQPAIRIDRVGALADFKIDTGLLITTGRARGGNGLARAYRIAELHVGRLAVTVKREVTAVVFDQHDQSVAVHPAYINDAALCHRLYRGAFASRDPVTIPAPGARAVAVQRFPNG